MGRYALLYIGAYIQIMDRYFDSLYHSTLWLLPIAIVLYFILKFNIVYKDNTAKEKFLSFTKKLLLIGIIVLPVSYLLKGNSSDTDDNQERQSYIDQCVADSRIDFLNSEQKNLSCPCAHDYLYGKYGNKIYTAEKFNFTLEDNREMLICFLRAKRPNITDSEVNSFRKIIINDSIIPFVLNEIKNDNKPE